jgi:IS605 OrfB family transposase
MKQVLTISCKLNISTEQSKKLDETMQVFAQACNHINEKTPEKLMNQIAMQSLIYQDVRALFGLSANLTIQALRRVCANRKTAKQKGKKVKTFEPSSVSYDARIFALREKDWTVSLTTIDGRERFALDIGNYQRGILKGTTPTSATLIKRQDGSYYIQIQTKNEPPDPPESGDVIGVDLGRTDIAFTSEGDSFSGQFVTAIRDKYSNLRAHLQQKAAKGTRSTRRRCRELLQRLSGKEGRYQTWLNHTISFQLVQNAKASNKVIALEDLTGIRERTNQLSRGKTERRRSNSWAVFQLRQFLEYKCIKFGVKLILVDPRYTSQTCHECLHIHPVRGESYRRGKVFECGHCGWKGDADLNGARNIANIGAVVNQPRGSWLSCSLDKIAGGLPKARVVPLLAVNVG